MSKLFYDHLIRLDKIESYIKRTSISHEEKLELWELIDGITHYRIIHRILEILPQNHHVTFMQKIEQSPYDSEILDFINSETDVNIMEEIEKESRQISEDLVLLLSSSNGKARKKKKTVKLQKKA